MTRRSHPSPWRLAGLALLAAGLLAGLGLAGRAAGGGDDEPKVKPKILVTYSPIMQFGFRLVGRDGKPAPITFAQNGVANGGTNTTVLRIDGKDVVFGDPSKGKFSPKSAALGKDKLGQKTVWILEDIRVTQTVEIVKSKKGVLDTALITYQIENKGEEAHKVGLRMIVDTLMVENDGTPFAVVGTKKLIEDQADFKGKNVPDAVQVMEKADLEDSGLVAYFSLKVGGTAQAPDRFSITHWPQQQRILVGWDVPVEDIDGDSAVVLYWNPRDLEAGASRTVGFAYGGGLYGQVKEKKKVVDDEK
jgi:hypothetical protein